jgi:hypothetical protein
MVFPLSMRKATKNGFDQQLFMVTTRIISSLRLRPPLECQSMGSTTVLESAQGGDW